MSLQRCRDRRYWEFVKGFDRKKKTLITHHCFLLVSGIFFLLLLQIAVSIFFEETSQDLRVLASVSQASSNDSKFYSSLLNLNPRPCILHCRRLKWREKILHIAWRPPTPFNGSWRQSRSFRATSSIHLCLYRNSSCHSVCFYVPCFCIANQLLDCFVFALVSWRLHKWNIVDLVVGLCFSGLSFDGFIDQSFSVFAPGSDSECEDGDCLRFIVYLFVELLPPKKVCNGNDPCANYRQFSFLGIMIDSDRR